jgi:hypothetical protein
MEVSGQLHFPAALPPGEEPSVPKGQRLGGPQRRSGRDGEEKEIPAPDSNRNPAVQLE